MNFLNAELNALWDEYVLLKSKNIKTYKSILDEFIIKIQNESSDILEQFSLIIIEKVEKENFIIDYNLFFKIILNTLIKYAKTYKKGYNKIIANHDYYFCSQQKNILFVNSAFDNNDKRFDALFFYERELSFYPDNEKCVEDILNYIMTNLDYSIHEIPEFGLVYECNLFKKLLDKYLFYIEKYNLSNIKILYRKALYIAIYNTWTEYLDQDVFINYKEYLINIDSTDCNVVLKWSE